MNAHTPPSSPQALPRSGIGARWRVWGWASLGVIVLPLLLLATPAGQRWAIRQAVMQLDQLLPDEAPPSRFEVGTVGIGWNPLGIALEDVRWSLRSDSQEAASLVRIRSLGIQPNGWIGAIGGAFTSKESHRHGPDGMAPPAFGKRPRTQ